MLKSTEVQDHILWQAVPVLAICCQFIMHYMRHLRTLFFFGFHFSSFHVSKCLHFPPFFFFFKKKFFSRPVLLTAAVKEKIYMVSVLKN